MFSNKNQRKKAEMMKKVLERIKWPL
jgi:hypothetical protein